MTLKKLIFSVALIVLLAACGHLKHKKPTQSAEPAPPTPQQMQDAMIKMSTPVEQHKILSQLVGNWSAKASMWMDPSQPPQVSKARSSNKALYGNKFVSMAYTGSWMGKKFEGTGLWGYNTITQEFESIWVDSASTQVMTSTGSYDPGKKAIIMRTAQICPIRNQLMQMKEVLTFNDPKKHTLEMFEVTTDGREVKMMEIVYSKK